MRKAIIAVVTFALAGSTAWAVTFSGGGGAGTSIVDANGGGDYTSLAEAAADFTGYPGGSTGDWTLLIRSDLTETNPSLFGNDTNGHSVTVRPDVGTNVKVTFLISERPAPGGAPIWDGNIVIGPNKLFGPSESTLDPDGVHYMDTDNFTIDGCNTPGGTERNLTLHTPESANTGTAIPRYTIRVVGTSDNSTIRNLSIIQEAIGNATDAYCCLLYNSRYVSEGALLYMPHGATIANCLLKSDKGNTGRGVYSVVTGPSSAGFDAIRNMVVTDCDIEVSHRAVQLQANADSEISYNRIRVTQESVGQRPEVILHTGSNAVPFPYTSNIIGNHVYMVETPAPNGFNYVIGLGGILNTNLQATFNVYNNMIGGINGTADIPAEADILGRAIAFENGSQTGNYNIRHNSISMADIPNYGPGVEDTGNRMAALSLLNSNGFSGVINFENNIVSYRQHNASLINSRATPTEAQKIMGTLNFNNNTYHLDSGALFAELNGETYNTLTEWQTTGRDLNSNVVNPFAPPSGGAWVSDSNLHFNAEPASVFDGVAIAEITTDIDGDTRPTPPTKGADEFVIGSDVEEWMIY